MAAATEPDVLGIKPHSSEALLLDLPLDVLVQIMGWLHPWEILSLSRTCKPFRNYLMSRASRATVWVPAFKSLEYLDIPKCPETLSEPQFAHILYESECDVCMVGIDEVELHISYEVNCILCDECLPKKYAPLREIIKDAPLPWGARELDDIGVEYVHGSYWTTEVIWSEGDPNKQDDEPPRLYHIDTIVSLQKRWTASQQDENAKTALAQEAKRQFSVMAEWASACDEFATREALEVKKERKEREERMRAEREEKVKERLISMGYEAEVKSFFSADNVFRTFEPSAHYTLYKEKLSLQSATLTDDEWNSIEEEMISIMLAERHLWDIFDGAWAMSNLIDSTFKPAFIAFAFSQPPNAVLPTPKEVALMPEWVKALSVEGSDETGSPNPDLVAAAVDTMPAFCDGVREWRTEQVLNIVRQSKTYSVNGGAGVPPDVLTLASTVFSCSRCDDRMNFPNVLVHRCNYWSQSEQYISGYRIPDTARVIERGEDGTSWSTRPLATVNEEAIAACASKDRGFSDGYFWNDLRNIKFDDSGHEHMLNLLAALGTDRRSSAQDLEAQQPYVEGLCQCFKFLPSQPRESTDAEPRRVMRWIKAIQGCRTHEFPERRKNWFSKPTKAYRALIPDTEARRRSWQSSQSCFWAIGGTIARRLYIPGERKRSGGFARCNIMHPDGEAAAREYAEARTLEAFAGLMHEKPLKLTVRSSSRRKGKDSVPA